MLWLGNYLRNGNIFAVDGFVAAVSCLLFTLGSFWWPYNFCLHPIVMPEES